MLANSIIINFIPCTNIDAARIFYQNKLGLTLLEEDEYALEFKLEHSSLRLNKVADFTPQNYTVFGWQVADINLTIKDLLAREIRFELFDGLTQDELRICTFPGGSQVAWFKDPAGNTLSVTQRENQNR